MHEYRQIAKDELILIIDDSSRFLAVCKRQLNLSGFSTVKCIQDATTAVDLIEQLSPDLLLVDIHLGGHHDGLVLLQTARDLGYRGLAVVVSGDSSQEQCFRAAKAGANDFLLKRPKVSIGDEVVRIMERSRTPDPKIQARAISDLAYLRSFGLTPREIEILEEFSKDYGSLKVIADRLDSAEPQVRKAFGRIYKKLEVNGISQLVHLLTICSMFSSR